MCKCPSAATATSKRRPIRNSVSIAEFQFKAHELLRLLLRKTFFPSLMATLRRRICSSRINIAIRMLIAIQNSRWLESSSTISRIINSNFNNIRSSFNSSINHSRVAVHAAGPDKVWQKSLLFVRNVVGCARSRQDITLIIRHLRGQLMQKRWPHCER